MIEFLQWIEVQPPSAFIRESASIWGYAMFLFAHVVGMTMLAGGATVISFALLGLWPKGAAVKPLEKLFPIMWVGFGLMLFTGVGLFMADATIRAMNWDFWIKMVFVAGGVMLTSRVRKNVFADPTLDSAVPDGARRLAWAWLFCWFCAVIAGRLIAYVGPVAGFF